MSDIKTPSHEKTKDEPGASVDEQVDDSFPASDPPSYNAGGRMGRPDRAKETDKDKRDADTDEKPKTERASHQGGGGLRSDLKPQGPGAEK